jgi:hypothetical protein
LGSVCPNAGEAVRLELDPDLQAIGIYLVHPTLFFLHPGQNAELRKRKLASERAEKYLEEFDHHKCCNQRCCVRI